MGRSPAAVVMLTLMLTVLGSSVLVAFLFWPNSGQVATDAGPRGRADPEVSGRSSGDGRRHEPRGDLKELPPPADNPVPREGDPGALPPGIATELDGADLRADRLSDTGPIPYRKERMLLPEELDEKLEILRADLNQMADPIEKEKLAQRIAELVAVRALNVAVQEAIELAAEGEVGRALDVLDQHSRASGDPDVRAFIESLQADLLSRQALQR